MNTPHQSLRIPGAEKPKDPLARPQRQILVETEPGKYSILGTTEEPLELLRIHIGGRHAMNLQSENMVIVDKDTGHIEERYENYKPQPQDPNVPITDANKAIRDRWIGNVIKWLLPQELWTAPDNPGTQMKIKDCLDRQGVSISISPGGCDVLVERVDPETKLPETLTAWSAMQ